MSISQPEKTPKIGHMCRKTLGNYIQYKSLRSEGVNRRKANRWWE